LENFVKEFNLDLTEQYEIWVSEQNRQGYSYYDENLKREVQDFIYFYKDKDKDG